MENFIEIPAIVVLCLLVGMAAKALIPEDTRKVIPLIVGFVGGILGIVASFTIPDFSADVLTAFATGVVSGLASTGLHQASKLL